MGVGLAGMLDAVRSMLRVNAVQSSVPIAAGIMRPIPAIDSATELLAWARAAVTDPWTAAMI